MSDYDLIIRGGTIADGSGSSLYEADVAVRGGLIAEVGRVHASADEEVDARDRLVTPGFIDLHTHLDGYVTWSERLAPTSHHGVTTVLFGNCGVGFAPCRSGDQERLVHLMEGVEDIPEVVLTEGLPWNWSSFPEYLDSLDRRRYDIDVAALLPHAPVRVYVMGQRAADREAATADDITSMQQIVQAAMAAGAFGFSTSRSINHRASDGAYTPSLLASHEELLGLSEAVGSSGKGFLQIISDFQQIDTDFGLLREMATRARRPLIFSLLQLPHAPGRWRMLLDRIERANHDGLRIRGQVCGRPVGLMLGLEVTYTPFAFCPTVQAMARIPFSEVLARYRDPEIRTSILEEFKVPLEQRRAEIERAFDSRTVDSFSMSRFLTDFGGMFPLGDPPQYEPPAESSIAAIAALVGKEPAEIAYDALLARDGRALIYVPAANFAGGNLDGVRDMLAHEDTVLGLGDAGAHCGLICDASFPTYMLTHWARDRTERLPVEDVVHALTRQGAEVLGLEDRGLIAPGMRADINVIDHARLKLRPPTVVYDLPAGGKRLTQEADGYVMSILKGVPTYREGQATGALPGRLLRSGRGLN